MRGVAFQDCSCALDNSCRRQLLCYLKLSPTRLRDRLITLLCFCKRNLVLMKRQSVPGHRGDMYRMQHRQGSPAFVDTTANHKHVSCHGIGSLVQIYLRLFKVQNSKSGTLKWPKSRPPCTPGTDTSLRIESSPKGRRSCTAMGLVLKYHCRSVHA